MQINLNENIWYYYCFLNRNPIKGKIAVFDGLPSRYIIETVVELKQFFLLECISRLLLLPFAQEIKTKLIKTGDAFSISFEFRVGEKTFVFSEAAKRYNRTLINT